MKEEEKRRKEKKSTSSGRLAMLQREREVLGRSELGGRVLISNNDYMVYWVPRGATKEGEWDPRG